MIGDDLIKVIMQQSRNAGYFKSLNDHAKRYIQLTKLGRKRKVMKALRNEKECLDIVIKKSQKRLLQIKEEQHSFSNGGGNE